MTKGESERAFEPTRTNALGFVSGRITVEYSDRGVPGLVVQALHVTGNGKPARLGSVSTSGQGSFKLEIPIPTSRPFLAARERLLDWNLQVEVLAPERPGGENGGRLLFRSEVRERAGRQEDFNIELSEETLEAAGIDLSRSETNAATTIAASQARSEKIREASDRVLETRLEAINVRRSFFQSDIRARLEEELSAVTEEERSSDRYVPSEESIQPRYLSALVDDLKALSDGQPDPGSAGPAGRLRLKSRLLLTEEQKQALTSGGDQPVLLSESELEARLGTSLDKPVAVYRRQLEPDPCRPGSEAEDCLSEAVQDQTGEGETDPAGRSEEGPEATGRSPTETPSDSNGNHAGDNVAFESGVAIARLMERQVGPEGPVEFGAVDVNLEAPLTAGGVSQAIQQVVFAPGPADVPALYDFHDLQIAFEPVWQEALDGKYLEDVEAAYDQIVERGGAPALKNIASVLGAITLIPFSTALFEGLSISGKATDTEVPASVISAIYISLEEWRALPEKSRHHLESLASRIEELREEILLALDPANLPDIDIANLRDLLRAAQTKETIALRTQIQLLSDDAERIVAHARRLLLEREAGKPFKPTHSLIEDLRHRRSQAYPFRYFAASRRHRSVNFGIIVTYQQRWTPISYQVGKLVSTVPLGPREVRKINKKTTIKRTRAQKEIESNLISRRREAEETSRSEAEIVARAIAKTHFQHTVEGTLNLGGGKTPVSGSVVTTSTFSRDAEKHSESVKREFREAILRSAEEYKKEHSLEVTTEESFTEEITESGEIQNPNDEIPATFLFYELQRRFRLEEKIHRLQSVVLVAQEVPPAQAIDKAWLIRHDWILNRVLLDDSFRPALTYLSTTVVSEDIAIAELRQALFRQRKLVEELKEDVADRRALAGLRYAALQRQIERTARSAGSRGGLLGALSGIPLVGEVVDAGLSLLLPGEQGPDQAAQIREGAARDAYDRERREEQELAARLMGAISTLDTMQREYNERLGKHLSQLAQCERLIAHVAQNIMYYMQAIWMYEPDDQRFLRLRNVPVPIFEKDKQNRSYLFQPVAMKALAGLTSFEAHTYEVATDFSVSQPPNTPEEIETKPLSEVADLNRPLGFLGNYMVFPMLESNPITEFMMDPYVTLAEGEYGVSDPDLVGNMTLEEFSDYICCLKDHFERQRDRSSNDDVSPGRDPFEELRPFLRETLKRLLERSLRDGEEIVVPSDSLYIEALPGAHSVMEKFKHLHRQIDVKAAQEETRRMAIDNVRRAQRILDGQLEDPDIEAKYLFEGDGSATIVAPGDGAGDGGGDGS